MVDDHSRMRHLGGMEGFMKLHKSLLGSLCVAAGIVLGAAGSASAGVTPYVGEDLILVAAPPATSAAPNSLAAATAFAATGANSLITFENAPVGAFTSLTVAPGVTISGADDSFNNQTIRNTTNFPSYPSVDGFNTTPGGSQFVELIGGTLTFTFATPIQSFGAYLSGVQTNFFPDSVTFSDGSSQAIELQGVGTSCCVGELAFVGFTDPGKAITSVTINAGVSGVGGQDAVGVDDVRFQTAVPEPAAWAMMLVGFGGLGAVMRSRRRMATACA
jgi:hypothetical protein